MGALVIINADDLGHDRSTTDAILEAFKLGRITSATAMVYMDDSERAIRLAKQAGLPLGLHLNLTEPYTDPAAPVDARERQARLARRFRGSRLRLRRWIYDPSIRRDVERCVWDQRERFVRSYGAPPTHLDGHDHAHVSPNVLLARAIPEGTKIRAPQAVHPAGRKLPDKLREVRRRLLYRELLSTDRFFDAADRTYTELPVDELASIELMVHPGDPTDRELIQSDGWARWIARQRLGSYADL